MRADDTSSLYLGMMLVAGSAVAYSTAGFFTQLITLDLWTVLFWRGLFGGLFIFCVLLWTDGAGVIRSFRGMTGPSWLVIALSAAAMIFFVSAFRLTEVANVVVIYATAPFIAAAIGWIWWRERTSSATAFAATIAFAGVAVMIQDSLASGNLAGDLLALLTTVALAGIIVVVRRFHNIPMVPAICVSAFISGLICWPMASPLLPNLQEIIYLALFGITQLGLGLFLLVSGARLIPAPQSALIGTLEIPLAPLWVWLAFGDAPLRSAFVGGALVIVAVLVHTAMASRRTCRSEC